MEVTIELLTKCNLKCKHCYIPNHNDLGLNTSVVIKLLNDLRNAGTLNLTLTGGEIFLRNDIFEIIETARKLNFRLFLLSNISMLNEDMIIRLSNLHIKEISTTIYSLDPLIHDSITQVSGSLQMSLKNIFLLKKYNIALEIKTPLMKDNAYCYKNLQKFCDQNGFRYAATPEITAKTNGDNSPHSLRINETELINIVQDIDNYKKQKGVYAGLPIFEPDKEPCQLICYNLFIDHKGDVFPCNSFYYKLGSIVENTPIEIWNNSSHFKKLKKMKKRDLIECTQCYLKDFCDRCPGLALLEGNGLYSCSPTSKIMASVKYKIYEGR